MTSNYPWWLAWPPAEVAATILPLFSQSESQMAATARNSIVNWCKTGSYSNRIKGGSGATPSEENPFTYPDYCAIAEAIQVLERAGLLLRTFSTSNGSYLGLTRLGTYALETKTVRQHLGLGDTPPTA
jgi:hypothetical protein